MKEPARRRNRAERRKSQQQAHHAAEITLSHLDNLEGLGKPVISSPSEVPKVESTIIPDPLPDPGERSGTNLWRGIFGWKSLFRWDVLAALVPGVFIAVGGIMLALDWFPNNLVIAEACTISAGVLIIVKTVGHAFSHRTSLTQKASFCIVICGMTAFVSIFTIKAVENRKAELERAANGKLSFCYIDMRSFGGSPGDTINAMLLGHGNAVLQDVTIRIVDVDEINRRVKSGLALGFDKDATFTFPASHRYTGFARHLYSFESKQDSRSFNVFIQAINGSFTELIRLRLINHTWLSAKRVEGSYYDKTDGLVLEEIDPGFTIQELSSDKGWLAMDNLKRVLVLDN